MKKQIRYYSRFYCCHFLQWRIFTVFNDIHNNSKHTQGKTKKEPETQITIADLNDFSTNNLILYVEKKKLPAPSNHADTTICPMR